VEDEYGGGIKKKERRGLRPLLPALGLVLVVAFGGISFVLGPEVAKFASTRLGFRVSGPDDPVNYVFMGILLIAFLALTAVIIAMATPKKKTDKLATEQQLKREKDEKEKERLARKARQREVQRKMAEERRRNPRQ